MSEYLSLAMLSQEWLAKAREYDQCADQDDIGDEEAFLYKQAAQQFRECEEHLRPFIAAGSVVIDNDSVTQSPQSDHGAAEREGLAALSERLLQLASDEGTAQIHDVALKIAAIASRPPQVGGEEPVAWRYRCHDGGQSFVLLEKRLTDAQKARGYYVGEDGDDYAEDDDALTGQFYWTDETPLFALPPAPTAPQEADRVREALAPNNDGLAEMLEGARSELRKAVAKIAKLEVEKADLANMVLVYAHRAETARAALTPASPSSALSVEDGED